ncbi:hypothetical protein ADICYQ_3455 [Cyclobacterium qasimii M12-11B]|uniref:Uncharacterized protein n=1 Tax=Cyclobacterium qasimii M12-11B TaxID=641524 RepID=S7VBT1_9BACT|nr:hypothetical protein ADICYQ_3455 [Cyclobacterium qasimii M12-11B]
MNFMIENQNCLKPYCIQFPLKHQFRNPTYLPALIKGGV